VDRRQLGIHPRRAAQIGPARRVARVKELAIQRLEVLPPHHIAVPEAKLDGTVADPAPGGLAALLHRRQVIPAPRSPVITGPSAAPIVLNGYDASCPRAMLTTTATPPPLDHQY